MDIVSGFTKEKGKVERDESMDNKKTVKTGYMGGSRILEGNDHSKVNHINKQ